MTVSKTLDVTQAQSFFESRSIAYMTAQYPMLSMIFVLREVVQLRELGFRIDVASINSPDRVPEKLTAVEAAEAGNAYFIKKHGFTGAAKAHCETLLTNLPGYLRGLRLVRRLAGLDLPRLALNLVYFSEALMVGVWMKRKKHRHLHVHLGSQVATVGMYARQIFGYGLSMTVHGPDEFWDVEGQYLKEKVAAVDFLCCISYFARSQLMRCSPYSDWNKLLVSRLGVDPSLFSPGPRRDTPEVFEILCVGRLTPAKGQHLLIDAMERLAKLGWRVRLRLVGGGADETSLRQRAAEIENPQSVIFEGGVNQNYIRDLYSKADLFCIASFAEGIPVVLMEAMAMGIPCVTTYVAGIPELIRDGIDGLLVAPSDLDGLVEALARLMSDVNLRERIAKSGRERVLEKYDLRKNVEQLATIFHDHISA
jgi:colanic acid/amylovoran biosynthesis glycosyltransferase